MQRDFLERGNSGGKPEIFTRSSRPGAPRPRSRSHFRSFVPEPAVEEREAGMARSASPIKRNPGRFPVFEPCHAGGRRSWRMGRMWRRRSLRRSCESRLTHRAGVAEFLGANGSLR